MDSHECDVCAGKASVADSKTPCMAHFLEWLYDPHQREATWDREPMR